MKGTIDLQIDMQGVFSTAGNIFVNIKDAIVSVFKSVVNGLIKGINAMKYHASWSRVYLLCEG